jgi:hypothetical protein
MANPQPDNRVRFDRTVNLGHILTFIGFLITAGVGWSTMDRRVSVLEDRVSMQRERDTMQDNANKDKFQEVRESLQDLKRSVEKVADKVGAK